MKSNDSKKTNSRPKEGAGYLAARAAEAEKQAAVARKLARLAKAKFKDARKAYKQAKKFAKLARKEAKEAGKALKQKAKRPRRKVVKKKAVAGKSSNPSAQRIAAAASSPRPVKRPKTLVSPPASANESAPHAAASGPDIAQA
jgi:hypothetical protein